MDKEREGREGGEGEKEKDTHVNTHTYGST